MKSLVLVGIFLLGLIIGSSAQHKAIVYVQTDHENKIEFHSADTNNVIKIVDVQANNPYLKLKYPFVSISGRVKYRLKDEEKSTVLRWFFLNAPASELAKLQPSTLTTYSDVIESKNHVVVADHLTLYGGGVLGIRSTATVYNADGSILTILPENNDGYVSPAVTEDGRYMGTNYGDIVVDAEYSLLPDPGFRIYDLSTNTIIYDIKPRYDLHSPMTEGNLIIQVLGAPDRRLEYYVFQPAQRRLYRRTFTVEEVGRFVRFNSDGFVSKVKGAEVLLKYEVDFIQSTF